MSDPVFELMVAITCSFIPSLCISSITLELLEIDEQPLYGQITIGMWIISTIILFILIHNDNVKRNGA